MVSLIISIKETKVTNYKKQFLAFFQLIFRQTSIVFIYGQRKKKLTLNDIRYLNRKIPGVLILQNLKYHQWWEFFKLVYLFMAQSRLLDEKSTKIDSKIHPWKIDHRVDLFTLHLPIKYNIWYFLMNLIIILWKQTFLSTIPCDLKGADPKLHHFLWKPALKKVQS